MTDQDKFFKKSLNRAARLIDDREGVRSLFSQLDKLLDKKNGGLQLAREDLKRLRRLIVSYQRGEGAKIPWISVVWALATVLYFVNPMDLIPDFLMGPGFVDDLGILMLCLRRIHKDLDTFAHEEEARELAKKEGDNNETELKS